MNPEIIFQRSVRARRLRLQITAVGEVKLIAPTRMPQAMIDRFLKEQEAWIERHVAKSARTRARRPLPTYQTGDVFYYLGEPLTLEVRETSRKRPVIKVRETALLVEANGTAAVKKAIEQFYKKKASEVIHDRLAHFNKHYGHRYARVTFRNQKSRWGSCSRAGNLNFNWRLFMAPIDVVDSVVVHELCHLRHMNHSARFWALVFETIPDHKARRKWLRENQILLEL